MIDLSENSWVLRRTDLEVGCVDNERDVNRYSNYSWELEHVSLVVTVIIDPDLPGRPQALMSRSRIYSQLSLKPDDLSSSILIECNPPALSQTVSNILDFFR